MCVLSMDIQWYGKYQTDFLVIIFIGFGLSVVSVSQCYVLWIKAHLNVQIELEYQQWIFSI